MTKSEYQINWPITFKEGFAVGKREAKQEFKKHKPKTTNGIKKVKTIIKERLSNEHWAHHLAWKSGYTHGALEAVREYKEKL